jgi:metal-responsive CopG/Arc/MetJ family transcriptional regulator
MPPKIANRTRRVNVIMPDELVKEIDDWRRRQPELPNISEAIRRMVEAGIAAKKRGVKLPLTEVESEQITPDTSKPRKHKAAKL